jgi:Protein of unknown function (DUF3365)
MLGQSINVASDNLADEGGILRSKRPFAFSLIFGLSALFITLQFNSAGIAPAQGAKVKQDGLISECSSAAIDALDECIQERFSKADTMFGFARVVKMTLAEDGSLIPTDSANRGHKHFFQAETEKERAAINYLERSGLQVGFYLCGGSPRPTPTNPEGILVFDSFRGPVTITPIAANRELPDGSKVWNEAKNALRAFKEKDQYEFAVEKWKVAARPIRARESCLECHRHKASIPSSDAPKGYRRLKAGDVLGIAMYVYADKHN